MTPQLRTRLEVLALCLACSFGLWYVTGSGWACALGVWCTAFCDHLGRMPPAGWP